MGRPPRCTRTPPKSKPELFDQAERVAFQHVREQLAHMAGCGLEDLEQAAFSYLVQSLNASGIQVRERWARGKATTWATWWHTRHSAARQARPHSQYSVAQAQRGRDVAAIRKRGRNDWQALRAQLARASGDTVADVAGELACSTRFIYKLSKRRFPRLVALVLALALGVNVPKSSPVATSEIQGIDQKEQLRPFTTDKGGDQMRPDVAGLVSTIGENDQIRAELAALYPHRAADLAHWAAQPL